MHEKSESTTLPAASFANASANSFFFGQTSAIASLRGCGALSRARAFLSMASGEESELVKPSHQAVASFLFVACVVCVCTVAISVSTSLVWLRRDCASSAAWAACCLGEWLPNPSMTETTRRRSAMAAPMIVRILLAGEAGRGADCVAGM